ncbi:alfa-L-arabinofuranosidase precursor [Pholiota conissans]|uniref:non-reducing end alpha-L-arabinofuranosidase n=1 Tax=Pholiota conissans TaxID=109636 RepID=A0A9P6CS16_9AGAR|nr:alfa-L-arabinofuranosidase precursor [Pholiota conissans]
MVAPHVLLLLPTFSSRSAALLFFRSPAPLSPPARHICRLSPDKNLCWKITSERSEHSLLRVLHFLALRTHASCGPHQMRSGLYELKPLPFTTMHFNSNTKARLTNLIAVSAVLASIFQFGNAQTTKTITVSATASHPVPSTMFGQMFEDISHSGDGGLYAELLQNRAFQLVTPGTPAALAGWGAVNSTIAVIAETSPISSALPNALELTLPSGTVSGVGFVNLGNSGFHIATNTPYKASFSYRFPTSSGFRGNLVVTLQDGVGTVLATNRVPISGSQTTWKQVQVTLSTTLVSGSDENMFGVAVEGQGGAGAIRFAMLSLFPPTFKNRENGMRADIAEALAEMKPSFFRLPGGNNLEGQTVATRWQWNATIGPLVDRPGRMGDWGYINTDGLGLMEYMHWCEDLGMEAIMAIWAGYALGGTSLAEGDLAPYIQQAKDQINFVIGDPSKSDAAAQRAKLGHPAPFPLKYVEVGNEDFFAATSYVYRWHDFVTALQAEFPDIHFIATSDTFNPILSPNPTEYDVHVYQTPTWFAQNSFFYDGFERNGTKYFEGEYAAISTNADNIFGTPEGRLIFPTMQSAAGEAAFMTGLERNGDIVFAASYAPLLGHVANNQWTPNLLAFDAGHVYRSTSYYVQKLFSVNRGDEYLPSTLPDQLGTVFWSVVRNTSAKEIVIKISNVASTEAFLSFVLPFHHVSTTGTLQLLTGNATASNTPTTPNLFAPVTSTISTGQTFNFTAPAVSVSVIIMQAF